MTPITAAQYFGALRSSPDITAEIRANADILLASCNILLARAEADGVILEINPRTGCLISGNGNGGWRMPQATVGAARSSHKEGRGVDVYDPNDGDLDDWCLHNEATLAELGLYIEHPAATKGWCHITTREPRSGRRVFYP